MKKSIEDEERQCDTQKHEKTGRRPRQGSRSVTPAVEHRSRAKAINTWQARQPWENRLAVVDTEDSPRFRKPFIQRGNVIRLCFLLCGKMALEKECVLLLPVLWSDLPGAMFMAALFLIAKSWKLPRCPSTYEWINEAWYCHTMNFFSPGKQ